MQKPELSLNIPFVLYLLLTLKEITSPLKNVDRQPKQEVVPSKPDHQVKPDEPVKSDGERKTVVRNQKIMVAVVEPRLLLLSIRNEEKADSLVVEVR